MWWSAAQWHEFKGNASPGVCAFKDMIQAAHPDPHFLFPSPAACHACTSF